MNPTTVAVSADTYHRITQFLFHEAELLDEGRFDDWLGILADDVQYSMPVRTTRARASGTGFDESMEFFAEDRASLEMRVKRLDTEFAWAEDPPSRTRRFVTNVRATSAGSDDLHVKSNLLLYRTRTDSADAELFSCAREDLVRDFGDQFQIAKRAIYIDQTVLSGYNLSIFF